MIPSRMVIYEMATLINALVDAVNYLAPMVEKLIEKEDVNAE